MSDERLMKPPCGKPCKECPWRRESVPGWLGPHPAKDWVALAHSDAQIACHLTIPEDTPEDGSDLDQMTTCSGAAIFRANVCKAPRTLRGLDDYRLEADREAVFGWNDQFLEHHERRI